MLFDNDKGPSPTDMFGPGEKTTEKAADALEGLTALDDGLPFPGADLTEAMRNFALALLVSGNRTSAYLQAYPGCKSANAAKTEGARLARDPRILRFQAAVQAKVIDLAAVSIGQIEEQAARIAFADLSGAFVAGTTQMKNPDEFPPDLKLVVQAISVQEGEKGVKYSVKLPDKNQALRLLAELKGALGKKDQGEGATSFHFHIAGLAAKRGKPASAMANAPAHAEPRLVGSGTAEPEPA